ncbi:MAG TPA: hypothetical protein VGH19_22755 [Verrucomicrobiae bacterium]
MNEVWVFNGAKSRFPSGVFTQRELAETWIRKHKLTGTLTAYPLDVGVYDVAVEKGWFKPEREEQHTSEFIGRFSAAQQEHYHYEDGELG